MKRRITAALLALAVVPATALAAEVDEYKGEATDDDKTTIKFRVKKNDVVNFRAVDALFKCDRKLDDGRKKFRATPPSFADMKINKKDEFEGSFDVREKLPRDKGESKKDQTIVHFKAKVNGEFKGDRKAKGDVRYDARYVQGPSQGARCETDEFKWEAKRQ